MGLVSDEPEKTSGVLGLGWSSLKLLLPPPPMGADAGVPADADGSGLSAGCCPLVGVAAAVLLSLGLPKRLLGAWFSFACTLPGFRWGVAFFGDAGVPATAAALLPTLRTLLPPPPPAPAGVAAEAGVAPLTGCSKTLSGVGGTLALPPVECGPTGCGGE